MATARSGSGTSFEDILEQLGVKPCPPIDSATPSWPSETRRSAQWFSLAREFAYAHHPSHGHAITNQGEPHPDRKDRPAETADELFCVPEPEHARLLAILERSRGGSVLVTGYRGTGKSSLVNYTVKKLVDDRKEQREREEREGSGAIEGRPNAYVPVRINLSTSRDAASLVAMMIKALYTASEAQSFGKRDHEGAQRIARMYWKSVSSRIVTVASGDATGAEGAAKTARAPGWFVEGAANTWRESERRRSESQSDLPYTLHEAQQDLLYCLEVLRSTGHQVIFLLDELDKLTPRDIESEATPRIRLIELQRMVSDLKFLLSEAPAFHIFIAGKDVDDSWQEDQNKGEGLFESVFIQNIYVPSMFTAVLRPTLGPHRWIRTWWRAALGGGTVTLPAPSHEQADKILSRLPESKTPWRAAARTWMTLADARNPDRETAKSDRETAESTARKWTRELFNELLREVGVDSKDWSYNTGLLILPHVSRGILERMLWRIALRLARHSKPGVESKTWEREFWGVALRLAGPSTGPVGREAALDHLWDRLEEHQWLRVLLVALTLDPESTEAAAARHLDSLPIMTERASRRLRYVIHYLTYKGRGIPRKILREFYSLVKHRSEHPVKDPEYWTPRGNPAQIVLLPTPVRQKLKFFSTIVAEIEAHPELFRVLDDKGCVATFHIVDYILKFFRTGFRWADTEYAGFMTHRRELFPSRELVETLLRVLEDVLIERVDRRQRLYMLLPQVKHDLAGLYLAFGPEQIELRFTEADLAAERRELEQLIARVEKTAPEQRLESFKLQIRLAEIYEDLGLPLKAIAEYSKALRWIRMDIERQVHVAVQCKLPVAGIATYVAGGVETLQRLGYLYEVEREFRKALHCYEESIRLHEEWWQLCRIVQAGLEVMVPELSRTPGGGPGATSGGLLGLPLGVRASVGPAGTWEDLQREHPLGPRLVAAVESMLPVSARPCHKVLPFTRGWRVGDPSPLHAFPDPYGLPASLNMLAVAMEKMWHRLGANLYLLQALDYYWAIGDRYGAVDQMILIGEMMVRRRDVRLAAEWYRLALDTLSNFQWKDTPDRTARMPEHQSSMRARLLDHMGDLYLATDGAAFAPCVRDRTLLRSDVETEMCMIRRSASGTVVDSRDDEYFYTLAASYYSVNAQPMRFSDVYMKKLLLRRWKVVDAFAAAARIMHHPRWQRDEAWETWHARVCGGSCRQSPAAPAAAEPALDAPSTGKPLMRKVLDRKTRSELAREVGDAMGAWCFFWGAAEKTLHALIDRRPGVRKVHPLELGRITDRRRFGAVYAVVGNLLLVAANRPALSRWYWEASGVLEELNEVRNAYAKQRQERYAHLSRQLGEEDARRGRSPDSWLQDTDLCAAAATIDRVLGLLLDNREIGQPTSADPTSSPGVRGCSGTSADVDRRGVNLCGTDGIGVRSALWYLSTVEWRRQKKCHCKLPEDQRVGNTGCDWRSLFKEGAEEDWRDHPNVYLVGQLYFLGLCLADKLARTADAAEASSGLEAASREVRTLYRAELALLGAHVMLDDSIRNLDAAEASRSLGVLYLEALRRLLGLRTLAEGLRRDPALASFAGDYDRNLAVLAALLHTAAKRFLVNAIDIYRQEREHERCSRQTLGATYVALGDLMTIRAECLESARQSSERPVTGLLEGLALRWEAFRDAICGQTKFQTDLDAPDSRRQAEEAYRQAVREFLSEIEDYTKRYRFPHEAYVLHQNISDRRMHFEICRGIRGRHWDETRNRRVDGRAAARRLATQAREMASMTYEHYPNVDDRQAWLKDVCRVVDMAGRMRPHPGYLRVVSVGTGSEQTYALRWRRQDDELEAADSDVLRRFFRSRDDGLAGAGAPVGAVPPAAGTDDPTPTESTPEEREPLLGRRSDGTAS